MKYGKLFSSIAVALAFTSQANAGVIAGTGIIDGAGGDTLILGTSGNKLASGIASAGYFNIADSEVTLLATAYQTSLGADLVSRNSLISAFVGLANDNFVTGATSSFGTAIPGGYVLGGDYGLIGPGSPLLNKTLYTFFGDGSSLSGSVGLGLAFHTGVVMTQDNNTPTPDSNDLALNGPYQRLIGTATTTNYDATALGGSANQSAAAFQLVGIPEPSAAILGAIGVLGLLRRRRN